MPIMAMAMAATTATARRSEPPASSNGTNDAVRRALVAGHARASSLATDCSWLSAWALVACGRSRAITVSWNTSGRRMRAGSRSASQSLNPHPDVSVVEAGAKVAREYADDRHVESVERKREAGQRRFVQILAPESMADDGRQLVDVVEGSTDGRLHAERVEVVVGDRQSPCDRGPITTATAERDDRLGGDVESRHIACECLEFAEGGAFDLRARHL